MRITEYIMGTYKGKKPNKLFFLEHFIKVDQSEFLRQFIQS